MGKIPEDIVAEIKTKSGSEGEDKEVEETKVDDTKKVETKTDDGKKSDGKADKDVKKTSKVQSIAQVADDIATDEDDEDDDDEEGDGPDKSKKRGSVFKELLDTRRTLKEMRRDEQSRAEREVKMMQVISDLSDKLEDLTKNGVKVSQEEKDELEQLIEEQGLDPEGTRKFMKVLEKKFGRPLTNEKKDEKKVEKKDDDDDEVKRVSAKKALAIEQAVEHEYETIVKAFPQLKDSTNFKAIKRFILADEENLTRSMEDIIREMYPKALGENQSIDGYNPDEKADDEKIDFQDENVIKRLKKDPALRKKHADDLLGRVIGGQFKRSE